MENHTFFAGWAEAEWTPEPGLDLLGQMHRRIATHARDPLMVCAVAWRQGENTVVLAAVDVCILPGSFIEEVQNRWARQSNLAESTLIIHATHTHVAPGMVDLLGVIPDPTTVQKLQDTIINTAQAALDNLEPVEVFANTGHLEQMGWNRRAMFEDGTSRMYGHSEMPGFVEMEGSRDPALPVLWTRNEAGEITGVLTGFATHPNCMESESFYSADLPGAVRKHLKKLLGEQTGVLYLTGAAGNTAPSILDPYEKERSWRGDVGVERSGLYLAGEAAKVIAATIKPMSEPTLDSAHATISVPLREWPQPGEPTFPRNENDYYAQAREFWPQHLSENNPWTVRLNALRIGDAVICTNPAELFVEFGLQIREVSPARVTFISELTDGYCGYVPTTKAFARGGYETWCAPSSQLDPSAGEQIVAVTEESMKQVFDNASNSINEPKA